jgi:hypothetical protein
MREYKDRTRFLRPQRPVLALTTWISSSCREQRLG